MTPIPATSGIYRITCTITGKFYIGSAVNLCERHRGHFGYLRHNRHHNPKLQAAWNKYGEASFTFEVLELVLPMSLTAREQYWFKKLKPFGKKGFNLAPIAGSSLGRPCPPEQRERLRQVNLGKKASPEAIENMRRARARVPHHMLGKHHTPEANEKNRQAHLGSVPPNRGTRGIVKASPETRAKLSQMRMGHNVSPETRAKLSKSNAGNKSSLGREHSAEERVKQARTRRGNKDVIATSPDGIEYTIQNVREFCSEHNLDSSALVKVAKGKYRHHRGWKARYTNSLWSS